MRAAVEAFHYRAPAAAEYLGLGFTAEHFVTPEVEVWEESWEAFTVYLELQNQWRCASGGAIALDYGVVFDLLRHRNIQGDDRDDLMYKLRIIEAEALKHINKG